jgi:predicted lipoprotein with Yx(FWY)xxD motif
MFASSSTISTRARRAVGIAVLAGAGVLVASACSSGASPAANAASPGATVPSAARQLSSPVSIAVGSSALGPIVVDASGHTLYRFDKDTPGSGSSACTGACAAAWPAALVSGAPTAGPGLTGTLGVITRADGTRQISLDGHPLYRYAGDQNPGDTMGDGFGGIWHAERTATSSPAAAPAAAPAPAPSSGY